MMAKPCGHAWYLDDSAVDDHDRIWVRVDLPKEQFERVNMVVVANTRNGCERIRYFEPMGIDLEELDHVTRSR